MSEDWVNHCYLVKGNEMLILACNKICVTFGLEETMQRYWRGPLHTGFSN